MSLHVYRTAFKTEYCGENLECLNYRYTNPREIGANKEAPYIYAGNLILDDNNGKLLSFKNGFTKIVVQLDQSLDQLFATEGYLGAASELEKLFSIDNITRHQKSLIYGFTYLGRIIEAADGFYESDLFSVPSRTVIAAIQEEVMRTQQRPADIIPLDPRKEK